MKTVPSDWQIRLVAGLVSVPETTVPPGLIPAGVLVGMTGSDAAPELILTRRSMQVAAHRGQISFPGGVCEPGDDSIAATALREALEEIGLSFEAVRILGYLPGVQTISDFWVVPVVGRVCGDQVFRRSIIEVDEVFCVPVAELLRPGVRRVSERTVDGVSFEDIRFQAGDREIWGVTGRIVDHLLTRMCVGASNGTKPAED